MNKQITIELNPTQDSLKGRYFPMMNHLVLIDATNDSFSFELPDCGSIQETEFDLHRTDEVQANTVTITTFQNQKINNEDEQKLYVGDSFHIRTDRVKWYVV